MARPKSEEKRIAILRAAAEQIGTIGIAASTAAIAKAAGVGEGTLFVYFPTKDELLNALYLHLKQDLRDSAKDGGVASAPVEQRARHSWDRYVAWGIANPDAFRAMAQLSVSDRITVETQNSVAVLFPESHDLSYAVSPGSPLAPAGAAFVDAAFTALGDITVSLALRNPPLATVYRDAGFHMLWTAMQHDSLLAE